MRLPLVWLIRSVLACVAVTVLARLLGGGTVTPLPQLAVFLPYAALAAVVAVLGALILRTWPGALAGAVLLAVSVLLLVPRFVPDPELVAEGGRPAGDRLRVMTANVLEGGADPKKFVATVRQEAPDLLAVEELTPEAVRRLDAAGLARAFPHRVLRPESGVRGMGLYSRLPLRDAGLLAEPSTFPMPWAVVKLPAGPVRVQAVHTYPPLPLAEGRWSDDLAALARQSRATSGRQVMLGDFNATLDHGPFREVLGAGLADVHDVLGSGIVRTWPSGLPLAHLDHVLIGANLGGSGKEDAKRGGITAAAVHQRSIPGSDHLAVVADLRVH
ncbi:endonuclease/exonuclease/phosphatase family protein [Streptomyces sp. TLI_185]|uniref:endonuclease/exonuclease/phosphatase family protein n=1 Tax=Streptomyces sp. TLI_185 TaxID=2485151 RepID=UPI00160A1443|nr:endonuclease/exonuclease/phosphatase family protein [Streptomyces sp. TLI_185]